VLKIVFEDDYFLVIDKAPGIVVTSSETQKEPSLEDNLKNEYKIFALRSGIVHRLDKDTSGLLVVGKNNEIVENLQSQFKERTIQKEYLALVHGFIESPGKIDAPIFRNPGNREKFIVDDESLSASSKEAVTQYQPEQKLIMGREAKERVFSGFNKIQLRKMENTKYGEFTLLLCHPQTGRTHQIRVHLKYIGHPIVGDEKYGGKKTVRLDHRWCKRQFLHAAKLELMHPITGKKMVFESKLPEDLKVALANLSDKN